MHLMFESIYLKDLAFFHTVHYHQGSGCKVSWQGNANPVHSLCRRICLHYIPDFIRICSQSLKFVIFIRSSLLHSVYHRYYNQGLSQCALVAAVSERPQTKVNQICTSTTPFDTPSNWNALRYDAPIFVKVADSLAKSHSVTRVTPKPWTPSSMQLRETYATNKCKISTQQICII